jgi:phosphatidylglycerol---prolipoprotein diacylglyceryl transferase
MPEPGASPYGAITVDIDPFIHLGPLTFAWHGIMIALGIAVGTWIADRESRRRGLDPDPVFVLVIIIVIAGMLGARALYLLENEGLLRPSEWLGTNGFSFYGAIILGVPAAVGYAVKRRLGVRYLDLLAIGFPAGMAVGRLGDVINGEHYGPASDLPWAVRNAHPEADVPSNVVAYHSGGLYEVVLALVLIALVWPLRRRLSTPGTLLCAVVAMYGVGRFFMFFVRDDSTELTLGLSFTQWTSLGLIAAAALGFVMIRRGRDRGPIPTG